MDTKLTNLNEYLFKQLGRLDNDKLTQEEIGKEVERTESIVNISEQIINNARIALDAAELVARHGVRNWENMLPGIENKPTPPGIPDYKKEKVS